MVSLASPLAQYRAHQAQIRNAINRVLESGIYILGAEVASFEDAFAEFCGGGHAVSVASGTDALILALKALGIGLGDEVITVSHTALATIAAILAAGATPVLIDVEEGTMTLDPAGIDSAITPRSKAVIAVHLYGQSADLDSIVDRTRRHGLALIEDCAQAAGGRYRGRRLGSVGDIGCFSFYPTKNLGAIGDGGMALTHDAKIAARIRRLRQYGWDDTRTTRELGLNSRLDPLQAAVLRAKLPHLDADNLRRAAIARRYERGLAGSPITTPKERAGSQHVYHLYVIACSERDELMAYLSDRDIGCAVHYPIPVHCQRGYAERVIVPPAGLPVTERICQQILSLPVYPELSDSDIDHVIAVIGSARFAIAESPPASNQ
ncbi:MAG TPA: DegT/DnrJ/EryC1/StrS family aminotransferase [Xanthobacteraceae bacterium]|jgi:dTDP-4-amino-4,6-dideoxygalactose transaminase|nr:DegT/DnrJ/EryC1/StrS family aminotransferase [Xanthobacteraceae bacterium]